jgi:hypothetical protein
MVTAYPYKGARMYSLAMELGGRHLDWQVVSAAQVSHALGTVFTEIEHLSLKYDRHNIYIRSGTMKLIARGGANFLDRSAM